MANFRSQFVNVSGLYKLIRENPENEYIERSFRGRESPENPLPMLHITRGKFYFLKMTEEGKIIASASVVPHKKGESSCYEEQDTLCLTQVSVHPDCRGQGLAKSLLGSVFGLASRTGGIVMTLTGFEPDGQKYLAPILPKIHEHFPDVPVLYNGAEEPITGKEPYVLTRQGFGDLLPQIK